VPTWCVDAALALATFGAAFGFVVLHIVDVHHDYAQEALRERDIHRYIDSPGTHGLEHLVQALGMLWFLVIVAAVVCAVLATQRRWTRVVAVAGVTAAAVVTVAVCKLLIRHPAVALSVGRPIGSFPSGHTTDLTAIIGVVVLVLLPIRWRLTAYAVAAVGGFVVGSTRVVSGAHTPDDVVTGWLFGLAFVLAAGTWLAARAQA
jgi:undecaprenyl-diphosphatase